MNIDNLTLTASVKLLREGKISLYELVKSYKDRLDSKRHYNGFIEFFDDSLLLASKIDEEVRRGVFKPLYGALIAVKDNISIKGKELTCASDILKGYVSPYDATIIKRLKENGAILLGRTNMDEFAMGSSSEFSAYGPSLNPLNEDYVVGGSSGGSATVLAASQAPFSLGSDTGGSVRLPASFTGLFGYKPTYGVLSRYGLASYASSLDQIGFLSKSLEDIFLILKNTAGLDELDQTSVDLDLSNFNFFERINLKNKKAFIIKEFALDLMDKEVADLFSEWIENLKHLGLKIEEISIKEIDYALSIYYTLSPVEAASNLARYDSIRYGKRLDGDFNLFDFYFEHKTRLIGEEVKRRIVLGNYLLSSGYEDKYYNKAKYLKDKILKPKFYNLFQNYDYMLTPTSFYPPFKLSQNKENPIKMYYSDICTVIANLLKLPAVTIPYKINSLKLPIGMQVIAPYKRDLDLLNFSNTIFEELKC